MKVWIECEDCEGLGATSDGRVHSPCDGSGLIEVEGTLMDWCDTHDAPYYTVGAYAHRGPGECVPSRRLVVPVE